MFTRNLLSPHFALTALCFALAGLDLAVAHADGVEFQPLPVEINTHCSSLVLQGTSRFAGTAFVVPKVFLSVNRAGDRLFEIIPLPNDDYLLRIALYIPTDPGDALAVRDSSDFITHSCNLNDIRTRITQSNGTPAPANQVLRLSALPIQQLSVRINGIDQPYIIGSPHTDILDYFGLDQVAEFTIHGRNQMEGILSRIRGEIGLAVSVDMGFGARSSSGFLNVHVDTRRIATDLSARFGGQISVVHADLAAAISDSLRSMNLSVYQEGDSDAFSQLAQSLITQIAQNTFASTAPSPTPASPPASGATPPRHDNTAPPTPKGPVSAEAPTPAAALSELAGSLPSLGYNVQAVVKALRDRQSLSLTYQRMGAIEQKTFTTSTLLRANLTNLTSHTLLVSSARNQVQFASPISANQQITLDVNSRLQKPVQKTLTNRWYSKAGLSQNLAELITVFPILRDIDFSEVTESETGDGLVAQYLTHPNPFFSVLAFGYYSTHTAKQRLKWGYRQWDLLYSAPGTTSEVQFNPGSLTDLPLEFSFSEIGGRTFKMNELLGEHSFFNATFDESGGKIVLNAERDLGFMRVKDVEAIPTTPTVLREYLQNGNFVHCFSCSVVSHTVPMPAQPVRNYQTEYALNVHTSEATVHLAPAPAASTGNAVVVP